MPGGNVSKPNKPYETVKTGSMLSPDQQAIVGGEILSGFNNLDIDFGLSRFGPTPQGPLHGEPKMMKTGSPARGNRTKPRKAGIPLPGV